MKKSISDDSTIGDEGLKSHRSQSLASIEEREKPLEDILLTTNTSTNLKIENEEKEEKIEDKKDEKQEEEEDKKEEDEEVKKDEEGEEKKLNTIDIKEDSVNNEESNIKNDTPITNNESKNEETESESI